MRGDCACEAISVVNGSGSLRAACHSWGEDPKNWVLIDPVDTYWDDLLFHDPEGLMKILTQVLATADGLACWYASFFEDLPQSKDRADFLFDLWLQTRPDSGDLYGELYGVYLD